MKLEMITVDCLDPDALAQWWAQAIGGRVEAIVPGEITVVVQVGGAQLGFQRVPDPTPGKNRLHLDFAAPDMDAEVSRLVTLGATEIARNSFGEDFTWVVLTDPAGNVFCVSAEQGD